MVDHTEASDRACGLRKRIDGFATELADLQLFLGGDPNPGAVGQHNRQSTIDKDWHAPQSCNS